MELLFAGCSTELNPTSPWCIVPSLSRDTLQKLEEPRWATVKGPQPALVCEEHKNIKTSHRTGREDLKHEYLRGHKNADRMQGPEESDEQPGTRNPEPEKNTQRQGPGPEDMRKMVKNSQGLGPKNPFQSALKAQELTRPMSFHAKPSDAFVTMGPTPHPNDAKDELPRYTDDVT